MQNGNDGFNFQRGNRNEQGVFAEVCFHIAWHGHSIKPSPDPVLDKASLNFKCEGKCHFKLLLSIAV